MASEESALVSALEIYGLFGSKYLHVDLTGETEAGSNGRRLSLLYGNNGSGKTTALRLLWHALSPSEAGGHRSAIAKTPFRKFIISLCNGDVINFVKTDGLVGNFTVTVTSSDKRVVEQFYRVSQDGNKVLPFSPPAPVSAHLVQQKPLFELDVDPSAEPMKRLWEQVDENVLRETLEIAMLSSSRERHSRTDNFVRYLAKLGAGPYMLADDRRIYGDDIERKGPHRTRRQVELEESREPSSSVAAELFIALQRAYEMIQQMVISGNVSGSRGSNNVYLGILEKISQSDDSDVDATTRQELAEKLKQIASKTAEFSKYGLVPKLREDLFLEVLGRTPEAKLGVADDVLQPFLEAQEARLDALSGVAGLLATITQEVNRFLSNSGKRFRYKAQSGIAVISEDGDVLDPDKLSSGERQILLLLLNTVLARQNTRLFLIDEPELSLNVRWQRQLMDALLSLTEGTPVQFIVATHSIEVITGHRDSLTRVTPKASDD